MTQLSDIKHVGYSVETHPNSKRIQVVTISKEVVEKYHEKIAHLPVQELEYKPFNRFHVADVLDGLCDYKLGAFLLGTLKDRDTGAFLLRFAGAKKSTPIFMYKS